MTKEDFARAEAFMLDTMRGATHDVLHVRRVLGYALLLAEGTAADREVVAMAALLHDIGRPEQDADPRLDHAAVGAKKAHRFLLAEGYGERFAGQVANCIARHRYRGENKPDTLEAQILFDADKLDVSGAMGAARTLQFGGEIGEPLYFIGADGKPLPGTPEEPDSFFRECNAKLRRLPTLLFTDRAKEVCLRRLAAMESFAAALWEEISEAHSVMDNPALEDIFK